MDLSLRFETFPNTFNLVDFSILFTVDCIYPWTRPLKTCFQMTSKVNVSGVKLWSLADRNANFCTQNTHHKHWIRAKLYTRNDSSEPVYVYRHRAASVSQKKSLYLIFPPFRKRNVLNFRRESCSYGLLNFKVWHLKRWRLTSWKHVFSGRVHG